MIAFAPWAPNRLLHLEHQPVHLRAKSTARSAAANPDGTRAIVRATNAGARSSAPSTSEAYFNRSCQYPGLRLEHSNASTVGDPSISAIKIAYRLNRSSR